LAKASQLAAWLQDSMAVSGHWMTLADDSGLEVDALSGEPGV
jgi:inosine/xanthosine triphosphate pyrophosphatase family protein